MERGDRGELDDSGDIVLLASLPESIFLLSRLGESESPGQGTEVNDVSTEGTDCCRQPTVDPGKLLGGVILTGLDFPFIPGLLRDWILEMT